MVLSAEQIKSIAKGVSYWESTPKGGLIPHRFSPEQEAVYRSEPGKYLRTQASSGVRLECRSDANALRLSCRSFVVSPKDCFCGLDLKIDGQLFGHYGITLEDSACFQWSLTLPQGEKTIALYLPCITGIEILELELLDATLCHQLDYAERILFLGDSITQGYSTRFPSLTYPAQVASHRNADHINQGLGAEGFHPEILLPLDWKPTLAFIAYGTNDWATKDRARLTHDAASFLSQFRQLYPSIPAVVLTPIWRADTAAQRSDDFLLEETGEILTKLAENDPRMHVISGQQLFPRCRELFADAKIHPNETGFLIFANRIAEALDQLHPSLNR